jgi:hypothetical protein
MKIDDLFNNVEEEDLFGFKQLAPKELKTELINKITKGPIDEYTDIEVLACILNILESDFIAFGTSGGARLNDNEAKLIIRAAKVLLKRTNLGELNLPFRDFSGFYNYWRKEGMAGSWAARREYIQSVFQPLLENIESLIDQQFYSQLSDPVVEFEEVNSWMEINSEVAQLRSRFASAKTPQDYSAVGTACVRIIEALSRVAYQHLVHKIDDIEPEPPVDKTDIRISRVIEVGLGGRKNEQLRSLAKASAAAAHRVKHGKTPTKLQAGIACDATILLASIVQRIELARQEGVEK